MKQPRLMQLGLVLILVANVSNWFLLHHHPSLGDGAIGAIVGVLYGLAIGTTLLAVRRARGTSRCRPSA